MHILNLPLLREKKNATAFSLVEMLGVITVIAILAGLTLGGAGAVRRHGAVNQAKAEIAALEAACARYYADWNSYPSNTTVLPDSSFNPLSGYSTAGMAVFSNLLGSTRINAAPTGKRYFEPKPSMVSSDGSHFVDPWGYPYGYYSDGTNPPAIWSTAGQTNRTGTNRWITSWPAN